MRPCHIALLLLWVAPGQSASVTVKVNAAALGEPLKPSWAYFGYDEANYTYAPNGQKLIRELVQLSPTPVHIRTHFLLTTGDGRAALKFGSTNVYTEDASGRPVYDWTLVDKILGTFVSAGAIPFVEIGFMPQALSTRPEPYTPTWIPGAKNEGYFGGWTYPPKDYEKWSELIERWVRHSVEKYGRTAVEQWDWEVWNEPDIPYWHGTPEEYDKLYDYAAAAVKRALPSARLGGPASTGPASPKAAAFLRQFLEHCASGKNSASGQTGAPLDFISYHAKGRPAVVEGHVRMGLGQEMKDVSQGFEIVKSFPQFAKLPIVLSEADPEGCAACSARVYPQNAYRNGPLYAAYEAAAWKSMLDLEQREGMNLQGILTWAFEFEDQPYFDGFRSLATNGIDKPVLNFFRMAGRLKGRLAEVTSDTSNVNAVATRSDRGMSILIWNYSEDDVPGPAADIALHISELPPQAKRIQFKQFRIDGEHSNAYTAWKQMESPQHPTAEQYRALEQAGGLEVLSAGRTKAGADWKLTLPLEGVALLELNW